MAVSAALVTVATTATQLAAAAAVTSAAQGSSGVNVVSVSVPTGGQTVYIGGSTVAASGATQGLPIIPGAAPYTVHLAFDDVLYGIVAATTQATNVLTAMATKDS